MINWFYDSYRILNKVYSDGAFIKQAILDVDIEEKNRAVTVKTCYGVLDKEIELSYYIKKLTEKTPKLAIRTVLKISMYAITFLQKKPYAVIDNAVELVKKLGKNGASGFVNAFLRKYANSKIELPKDLSEFLSVKYSYPLFVVKKLLEYYGKERTENIIGAQNDFNTLVFYDENGEEYLKTRGVVYEKTAFDNVFNVKNFTRNDDYDKGVYTFQALGSVAICEAVNPCENLLDCCSAPGGKSVRLSYKCKSVTAWDIHPHRVDLIKAYAKRMKRDNIIPSQKDGKEFDKGYERAFDAVLCDAPCSGLGVINENPDIRLNRGENNVAELVEEQRAILDNVCKYVKVGGFLYYSTCSVLPEENMLQAQAFIERNKNYKICEIDSLLPHEKRQNTVSFLPDISGGLGFFIAKFQRIE